MTKYNLTDYGYHLPRELIAQEPLSQRDRSRLLVLNRGDGSREQALFKDLPRYLDRGDLLVLNNTKVIPARLLGQIEGRAGEAEILLLHETGAGRWMAMVKPGRKLRPGARVRLAPDVTAIIAEVCDNGLRVVEFAAPEPIENLLHRLGKVPLPPYITREVADPEQYQTIYAAHKGSAAAPTAGFHFTADVFRELQAKGVETAFITLHIGPGTFQPVKTSDIREHVMHLEYYRIDKQTVSLYNSAKERGNRVVAVGTTVCRVLETLSTAGGKLQGAATGWTDLFIYPGYRFKAVDALITNFHLPQSTLLMLVGAFAGYEQIMAAYREAVERQYRFFSFGDAMLII